MIYTDMHQQTALDVRPLKANAGWFTGVRITATSAELSPSLWEDNILTAYLTTLTLLIQLPLSLAVRL